MLYYQTPLIYLKMVLAKSIIYFSTCIEIKYDNYKSNQHVYNAMCKKSCFLSLSINLLEHFVAIFEFFLFSGAAVAHRVFGIRIGKRMNAGRFILFLLENLLKNLFYIKLEKSRNNLKCILGV